MGVYLSEINMPKGEGSKLVLQIFPNGEVYDEHGIRLGISNWAEAVPVPPHGDLIDRDKIAYFKDDSNLVDFDYAYRSQINSMPAIILAEEGE